jgi:hypothetical protein
VEWKQYQLLKQCVHIFRSFFSSADFPSLFPFTAIPSGGPRSVTTESSGNCRTTVSTSSRRLEVLRVFVRFPSFSYFSLYLVALTASILTATTSCPPQSSTRSSRRRLSRLGAFSSLFFLSSPLSIADLPPFASTTFREGLFWEKAVRER